MVLSLSLSHTHSHTHVLRRTFASSRCATCTLPRTSIINLWMCALSCVPCPAPVAFAFVLSFEYTRKRLPEWRQPVSASSHCSGVFFDHLWPLHDTMHTHACIGHVCAAHTQAASTGADGFLCARNGVALVWVPTELVFSLQHGIYRTWHLSRGVG
jgi:hypothetical protein